MYIVLIESSYHVDGDERSRTNPGHGYPAHTVDYIEAVELKDADEVTAWVIRNEGKKFRVFQATPVTVEKKFSIKINATRSS